MKGRKLILLGLWILSLIGISFYGGAISYGFFFGVTLIPVISGIYLLYVYVRFLIYQEVNIKHVVCGEAIPYFFVLQNDDMVAFTSVAVRLFSEFSYVENVPDNIEYELLPGEKIRYETKLTCKYRGEYQIGVKEIIITDFLKVFQIKYKIPAPVKTVVYPRIIKLEELKSIPEINVFLQKDGVLQEMEPDVAVRDYVAGDPIKRIHWKATAREQKLKVRLTTGEEKQGIAVICDTKRFSGQINEYLPAENKMLETLLALGFFFAKNNTRTNMIYEQNGMKTGIVDDFNSFNRFYREISGVWFGMDNNLSFLMEQLISRGGLAGNKAVFIILQEINDTIMEKVHLLAAGGTITILYVVTDQDISEYRKLSTQRMKIITIPVECGLEEML